jgi:hypothetical protein
MKKDDITFEEDEEIYNGEDSDCYNPKKIETAKELLKKYYAGELSTALKSYFELALDSVKGESNYKALELMYGKHWHPEHIAKVIKCTERCVPQRGDKVIGRLAILLFGIDAFDEKAIFPG